MKLKQIIKKSEMGYFWGRIVQNYRDPEFRSFIKAYFEHPALVKVEQMGNLWSDRLFYILNIDDSYKNSGFFALWNDTLRHLVLAKRIGSEPYISWINTAYSENPQDNVYEYFFEQTTEIPYTDISDSKNVIKCRANDGYTGEDGSVYGEEAEYFEEIINVCKKYIRFNKETQTKLDDDISIIGVRGKQIVGVHVRGTDYKMGLKGHPKAVAFMEYLKRAEEMINSGKAEYIFLATDDKEAKQLFKEKFGDRLLSYDDVFLGDSNIGVHYSTSDRGRHKYLLGYEVLRDAYTLAECQYLIAGVSHVSFATRVMNAAFKNKFESVIIINKGINANGPTSKEVNKEYFADKKDEKNIPIEEIIKEFSHIKFSGLTDVDVSKILGLYIKFRDYKEGAGLTKRQAQRALLAQIAYQHYEYEFHLKKNAKVVGYCNHMGTHHVASFVKVASVSDDISYFIEKLCGKRIDILRSIRLIGFSIRWFWQMRNVSLENKWKIWLISYLPHVYELKQTILTNDILSNDVNMAFVFYDLEPCQNLFVQMAQNKGIKTATLQHGAGFFSGIEGTDSISNTGIEYYDSISDYMLLWNEFAFQEGLKCGIDVQKMKVLGIPKFIDVKSKECYEFQIKHKCFAVILDITSWGDDRNRMMLSLANEVAKEMNLKYIVRYHPTDHGNEYDDLIDKNYYEDGVDAKQNIEDLVNYIDFSVVDGSSVFVEFVYLRHPAFRYEFDEMDKFAGVKDNSIKGIDDILVYLKNPERIVNGEKVLFDYYCSVLDSRASYLGFFENFMR